MRFGAVLEARVVMSRSAHAAVDWHLQRVTSTVVSRRGGGCTGQQNRSIVETNSKNRTLFVSFECTNFFGVSIAILSLC